MKPQILFFIILIFCSVSFTTYGQDIGIGEKLFKERCQVCHSIGKGKVVGPDLKNVANRRDEDWIIKFVQSPSALIESGDETAVKVFNEHDQIPMPDHKDLQDPDVKNIIAFISDKSSIPASAPETDKIESKTPSNNPDFVQAESKGINLYQVLICLIIVLIIMVAALFIRVLLLFTSLQKNGQDKS